MEEIKQQPTDKPCIVGLRFQPIGKLYHFDASDFEGIQPGDYVVVETSRGAQLGQIAKFINNPDRNATSGMKSIMRIATPQDLLLRIEERGCLYPIILGHPIITFSLPE